MRDGRPAGTRSDPIYVPMDSKTELRNGARYRVKMSGRKRSAIRIFKWTEKRFRSIRCFVFTAPVSAAVTAEWNQGEKSLFLRGPKIPRSEVSVPYYDLISCEPV